jgi:hypothetical protein
VLAVVAFKVIPFRLLTLGCAILTDIGSTGLENNLAFVLVNLNYRLQFGFVDMKQYVLEANLPRKFINSYLIGLEVILYFNARKIQNS